MFKNRYYQDAAINNTMKYWCNNPGKAPIIVLPTGSGKSVVSGGLSKALIETYPQFKPRGIITVPSKELCEQNYEKVKAMIPGVRVGMYSSSVGIKQPDSDIVIATIGSVKNYPPELGPRMFWINDECHLTKSDGTGIYWSFLRGMHRINTETKTLYCHAGMTATPFKGNGVWLTDGKMPLYHGISHNTPIGELLEKGFLSPLVNPQARVETRIDTSGIEKKGDDFDIPQLSERTKEYLVSAAYETSIIASERKKWMAFLPDISSAEDFNLILNRMGITAAVVHGKTESKERERIIEAYKSGFIRCLITVVALTTGFDVPDIDCLIWLRSTHSYVLYMQGAGRGTRIAPGKKDCLWIDFTDTTERLGAIDQIKGRPAKKNIDRMNAPCIVCENCGEMWTPASKEVCIEWMKDKRGNYILDNNGERVVIAGCGHVMRTVDNLDSRYASQAEIMATINPYPEYQVSSIALKEKKTKYNKKYIALEFYCGMELVLTERIFFSGVSMTPKCYQFWKELTGDYMLQYNNFTSCFSYISNQLIHDKTLGIKCVKLDRTQNAKNPTLCELMR